MLLLLSSAVLSFFLGQGIEAIIIIFLLFISSALGFWQEYTATNAVSKLLEIVKIKAGVIRDGKQAEVPVEVIVPGDITILSAGDIIPGDALILQSNDLFVNESALTGETFPAEKTAGIVPHDAPLPKRTNSLFMATSANFGNMFSMAVVSVVLPFLPLLPTQVLLTNLLQNFPQITIASDSVDDELVSKPRRWSIRFITDLMVFFGLISSIFECVTFGALLLILHASIAQFRTGWFIESVISASLVVLIIRTRRPFFRSRPSNYLLGVTLAIILLTVLLPYSPLSVPFGFTGISTSFLAMVAVIIVLYMALAELSKKAFYSRVKY